MDHIALENVSVRFDSTSALEGVDFEVRRGQILALLGEHGSGKSTLCHVLAGFVAPSDGTIVVEGRRVRSLSVRQAQSIGIRLVNQENRLVETMSVAGNLYLNNRRVVPGPLVSHGRIARRAGEFLAEWGLNIDPMEKAANLHEGDRLVVNLLKHLCAKPALLILDESFEKLTLAHLEKVKRVLAEMCNAGMALLVVTHRVDQLDDFAHRVAILRSGRVLFQEEVQNTESLDLVRLAYTQLPTGHIPDDLNAEYYSLLKFNRAILQHLPVSVLVVDEKLRIKIANESARAFLGCEDGDTFNLSWEATYGDRSPQVTRILKECVENPSYRSHLNVELDVAGRIAVIDLTTMPIRDGRKLLGLIVVMIDVTEKEQMRDRMVMAEKLTSVGLLSAGVAHEINNPLEIISNYVDQIRVLQGNGADSREALEGIEEEISSIAAITRNLVLFGETRTDGVERVELNDVLGGMVSLVRHRARQQRVDVVFSPYAGELYVEVNPAEIKQVILNIVRNAFEAMDGGGILAVAVRRGPPVPLGAPPTSDQEPDGGGTVEISFRDSGPGLVEIEPDDVFLPFVTTKSKSGANLGLGLSISYSIAQRHGGSISGQTHPEGGAEFTLRLPLSEGVGDHG